MSSLRRIEVRVAGILVREDAVLLVEHRQAAETYWVVPGGRVEYGETCEEALRREFKEELSMDIAVGAFVCIHDAVPPNGERHVVNIYFWAASDDDIDPDALVGVERARFFGAGELSGIDLRPPLADMLTEVVSCSSCQETYLGNLWQ